MGNVLVKEETLTQIADAIREKTGTSSLYKPGEMPDAILEISTYSGEGADPNKPVRFYNPYGDLVYSYTVQEIAEMTELPELPEYAGLIGQEWNWSLENIQAVGGKVEIGSLYTTDDGSTRIYIDLIEEALNPKIGFNQLAANSVWIDWGDGSDLETSAVYGKDTVVSVEHQYAHSGKYVIRLIPENEAEFEFVGDYYSTLILHKVPEYNYGNQVFSNAIQKIEIGKGITKFDNRCFNSATLECVTVPKEIASFGNAFQGCENIKSITFPRAEMSLPSYAIRDCYMLEKVLFSEKSISLGGTSFSKCHNLKELILPGNINLSYSGIFADCYSLRKVTILNGVKRLGSDIFTICYSLEEIVLPDTLTSISSGAFSNCISVKFVDIPEAVTTIASTAFYYCHALRRIKIPEKVTEIAANTFAHCYSLRELTVPKNVTDIGASAFSSCLAIEDYYILPTTPPTLSNINTFDKISDTCKIHVPKGCLEAYQTAENWSTYADYMVEMEE